MENDKRIVNYILIFFLIFSIIVFALFIILSRQARKTGKNATVVTPLPSFFNPSKLRISPKISNLNNGNSSPPSPLIIPTDSVSFLNPSKSGDSSRPSNSNNSNLSLSPSPSPLIIPTDSVSPIPFTGVKEEPFDPQLAKKTDQIFSLIKKTPVIFDNLKINYDFKSENFVISPQSGSFIFTEKERNKVYQWFEENYPDIPKNKIIFSSIPYISPTPIPRPSTVLPLNLSPTHTITSSEDDEIGTSFKALFKFLKTISDIASTNNPSVSPINNENKNLNNTTKTLPSVSYQSPKTQYPYVYYPQCNGPFDSYPLGRCNICQAGCGPTTAAMIIASYKDKTVDPRHVVSQYAQSGYYLGCDGTTKNDAQKVLAKYGVNVGSDIFYYPGGVRSEVVVSLFKEYINVGKTVFVLANFCSGGCGHYFWVVDVDKNDNIWSFDPAYGRYKIPYNQNSRYPFPLYRVAFTVSP